MQADEVTDHSAAIIAADEKLNGAPTKPHPPVVNDPARKLDPYTVRKCAEFIEQTYRDNEDEALRATFKVPEALSGELQAWHSANDIAAAICSLLDAPAQPSPDAGEGEVDPLEYLTTHFIVKDGPNAGTNQYGHLELWWAAKSVNEEPSAAYNPWMLLGEAQNSYSLVAMGELRGVIAAALWRLAPQEER